MLTSDPIDVLFAHNHWATAKVLHLCRKLSNEQFHTSFPIGPGANGGLHTTTTHIVATMRDWADRLLERPIRPCVERRGGVAGPEYKERSPDELLALLDQSQDEMAAAIVHVRKRGLNQPLAVTWGDHRYAFTLGSGLMQVLTHGHYHRAQCLNMLRRLEIPGLSDTLPELDVVDWQYEVECGSKPMD